MRLIRRVLLATALSTCLAPAAWGWSNHTLCTWQAVAPMSELSGKTVTAEPVTFFLRQQAEPLAALLDAEEKWARGNLPFYAPRPDGLAFQPTAATQGDDSTLLRAFLHAIRANEHMPLALYAQRRPGVNVPAERQLDWPAVSTLDHVGETDLHSLERIEPGSSIAVTDVFAAASNEPDFGLDIGLWQDNGTDQGRLYAYGEQPFGNPRLDYSSQAPFHMGFFHEAGIIYRAAPYLQRSHVEARIHLYTSLARFAFAQGHAYWGWRFAGWAAHYVQDLAQPYHSRVLPGVGATRLIWISALDQMGFHHGKEAAVNLVTNRHTMIENYQSRRMLAAYLRDDMQDPLLAALRDTSDDQAFPAYLPGSTRDLVTRQAADVADLLDSRLEQGFPARYVADPDQPLDDQEPLDAYAISSQSPDAAQVALTRTVSDRMRQVGRDTRALIRALAPATPD